MQHGAQSADWHCCSLASFMDHLVGFLSHRYVFAYDNLLDIVLLMLSESSYTIFLLLRCTGLQ